MRLRALAVTCVATAAVGPALTAPAASGVTVAPPSAAVSPASKTDRGLPIIRGRVGPGFTISVSQHRARPRRYTLIVRDRGARHNWHIRGPGVDRSTGVRFVGRRQWTVRFRADSIYRIVCDPHSSQMRTRIVVD